MTCRFVFKNRKTQVKVATILLVIEQNLFCYFKTNMQLLALVALLPVIFVTAAPTLVEERQVASGCYPLLVILSSDLFSPLYTNREICNSEDPDCGIDYAVCQCANGR